jgi:hypothetical protein
MNDLTTVGFTVLLVLAIIGWALDRSAPRPGRYTETEDDE